MNSVIFILTCILIIYYYYRFFIAENFDTYNNHLIGIYDGGDIVDTAIAAKYTWNHKRRNGDQLYDRFYTDTLAENNDMAYDPGYSQRDINSSYLDSRFETASPHLASYLPVATPQPFVVINGEQITLAQHS